MAFSLPILYVNSTLLHFGHTNKLDISTTPYLVVVHIHFFYAVSSLNNCLMSFNCLALAAKLVPIYSKVVKIGGV